MSAVNEQKHTPTPWSASHNTGPTMQGYMQSSCVTGTGEARMKIIAGCFKDIGGDDVAAANAEFIVRAVNSHEQLVASLKETREFVKHYIDTEFFGRNVRDTLARLDAALAAAGAA